MKKKNVRKSGCPHDYKNAIPTGSVDHVCPLCGRMLDSSEWFLMTHFDTVDVTSYEEEKHGK